jgi:serine/threonine protein kinase
MRLSTKIRQFNQNLNRSVSDFSLLPSLENGRFLNSFTDIIEIGQGSYGAVFKSRHKLENRTYAIKKINFSIPKGRNPRMEALFREVEAMLSLEHRNVVRYITSWIELDDSSSQAEDTPKDSGCDDTGKSPTMNFNKKQGLDFYLENNPDFECSINPILQKKAKVLTSSGASRTHSSRALSPCKEWSHPTASNDLQISFGMLTKSKSSPRDSEDSLGSSCSESRSLSPVKGGFHSSERRGKSPTPPRERLVLFIQMEYCKGASLLSYIKQQDFHFSDSEVFGVFTQIVEGLCYIHGKHIVHRDLKPGNILFDESGLLKICDFGLAIKKLTASSPGVEGKVQAGEDKAEETLYAGTPLYCPLETSNDHSPEFDSKMDVYALGIILFELLSDFKTDHHKLASIRALKANGKTTHTFRQQFGFRADIVEKLVRLDKEERPDAADVKALPEFKLWEAEIIERFREEGLHEED